MINSGVIVGRVGQDPEMKYFETGKVKTAFSVAVNRWTKEGDKTDWFNIECWDKQAEIAGEYVTKGKMIAVVGSIVIQHHNDKVYSKINARDIRLLGGRNE